MVISIIIINLTTPPPPIFFVKKFGGREGLEKITFDLVFYNESPVLEFNVCMDHTTEGSLGMENMFAGTLNALHPCEKHNCLPVMSHDQKDNFNATKVVAHKTISQVNSLLTNTTLLNLCLKEKNIPSNLETHDYTTQPNIKLLSFCKVCHRNTNFCSCSSDPKFICTEQNCTKKFSSFALLKTHRLLDHTKTFNPKKKRKVKDLDPALREYHERRKKQKLSKHSNLQEDPKTTQPVWRTRTTTITPVMVDSTKAVFKW